VYGCPGEARPYPQGWRCVEHAPEPPPTPPAGTTLADRLAEHGKTGIGTPAGETVVDQRAIASGKRRASLTSYRAAQAATPQRKRPPDPG
jgi:hypothetical protein